MISDVRALVLDSAAKLPCMRAINSDREVCCGLNELSCYLKLEKEPLEVMLCQESSLVIISIPLLPCVTKLARVHARLSRLLPRVKMKHRREQSATGLTTLLGLVLPRIDTNDVNKTMHSLAFIQASAG